MIKVVPNDLMELITTIDREFNSYSESFPYGPEQDSHWQCTKCSGQINEDNDFGIFLSENTRICQTCADTHYRLCDLTQSYNDPADMITVLDGTLESVAARNAGKKLTVAKRAMGIRRFKLFTCAACGSGFHGNATALVTSKFGEVQVCKVCSAEYSETMCGRCHRAVETSGLCGCTANGSKQQDGGEFTSPSQRMSQRFVGLELETMRGSEGSNRRLCVDVNALCPTWGWKGDGSVDGLEFVSPKIGGGVIERDYGMWFEKAALQQVGIEHYRAGYHVHVDARDIFALLRETSRHSIDWTRAAHLYGSMVMLPVAQAMISPRRRSNNYCQPQFAIRGVGAHPAFPSIDSLGGNCGYPAVAIRSQTFEFRAFPSTSNPNYHLSRIEVAQRLVDLFHKLVKESATAPDMTTKVNEIVRKLSVTGTDYLMALQDVLGLSDVSMRYIAKIHKKWNAEQYNGTTKHNTEGVVEESPTFTDEEKKEFAELLAAIKAAEPVSRAVTAKKLTQLATVAA